MNGPYLKPEDYLEPTCPLCDPKSGPRQIPLARVLEKLDEHIARRDVAGALRHLNYWCEEAAEGKDDAGLLSLLNEKMGVLRNDGQTNEAIKTAKEAMDLIETSGIEGSVCGTVYLNAGTVMSASQNNEEALALYGKALENYRDTLDGNDPRLAGLYNNAAVVLTRLERYDEARKYYENALSIARSNGAVLDCAVTYTNLATLSEAEKGLEAGEEEISRCLQKAKELLDDENLPQDASAAFVYAKCAPVYGYYGWFIYEQELMERSQTIYERA